MLLILVADLAISLKKIERIDAALLEDEMGTIILRYISSKWPPRKEVLDEGRSVYAFRDFFNTDRWHGILSKYRIPLKHLRW